MKVDHRDVEGEDDLRFVVSTWSRAFKASPTAGMIADEDWPDVMHAQIRKLIARPGVRTVVACDRADPRFLYGFACGEPSRDLLHFVYVKQPFRRAGYDKGVRIGDGHARRLLAELGIAPASAFRFTFWTYAVPELAAKIPRAAYDPNLARYPG